MLQNIILAEACVSNQAKVMLKFKFRRRIFIKIVNCVRTVGGKVSLPDFELQHNLNLTKHEHKSRLKNNNGHVKCDALDFTTITTLQGFLFLSVRGKVMSKFGANYSDL